MGPRTKRMMRLARLFPELPKFQELERELNGNWMMLHASREASFEVPLPISVCDAGQSEADRVLAESNYEVARERIEAAMLFDDGVSTRTDHWVGPPITTLVIRGDDAGAVREAARIIDALEMYGVLDEADYDQRCREEAQREWAGCYQSDVEQVMTEKFHIPEDLFSGEWEGFAEVDLDALVGECPTWVDYASNWQRFEWNETLNLEQLAAELAERVRRQAFPDDPEAAKSTARDCWCCGAPVIGPVWVLCDGCQYHDRSGKYCDADDSWHCDGRDGHECDGTVCEEAAADARYEASLPEIYGGMHPDKMTPLW